MLKRRAKRGLISFAKRFSDLFGDLLGTPADALTADDLIDDEEGNSLESKPKIKNKKKFRPNKSNAEKPTDQTPIILEHPDTNLIRQVVRMGQEYHDQIRNDPLKIFDPSKEFTDDKLTVCGWGM